MITAGRYGCVGRRSQGLCQNDRTIGRRELEERILSALREQLLTPELVAEFARAYQEERNRNAAEAERRQTDAPVALAAIQRKIGGIMAAIEGGLYQPSIKQRLTELEHERQSLETRLSEHAECPAILVHPNLAEVYRRRVANLESLLEDPELWDEAMEAIRSMIETIVVTPRASHGVSLELHGDLRGIWRCVRRTRKPRLGGDGVFRIFGCGGSKPPLPNTDSGRSNGRGLLPGSGIVKLNSRSL